MRIRNRVYYRELFDRCVDRILDQIAYGTDVDAEGYFDKYAEKVQLDDFEGNLNVPLKAFIYAVQDSEYVENPENVNVFKHYQLSNYVFLGDLLGKLRYTLEGMGYTVCDPVLPPDTRLGDDFRIVGELGRGGMGIVYQAEDMRLDRHVAVKMMKERYIRAAGAVRGAASLTDSRTPYQLFLDRFQKEAKVVASLRHTNIVPILSYGVHNGRPYHVSDLIVGISLSQWIEEIRASVPGPGDAAAVGSAGTRGRIAPRLDRDYINLVVHWILVIATALEHAHGKKVVHRDIKPANILIDGEGVVHRDVKPANILIRGGVTTWLTDFGLAQLDVGEGDSHGGTPRYMSPEQVQGDTDKRTDIYSLGVTLYELLTLRAAVEGEDTKEIHRRVVECEPIPLKQLNPWVPGDLDTIVRKMTRKRREDRYQTAGEVSADLACFLELKPLKHAERPGFVKRLRLFSHRSPVAFWLFSLVLALSISVALLSRKAEQAASGRAEAEASGAKAVMRGVESDARLFFALARGSDVPEARLAFDARAVDTYSRLMRRDPVLMADLRGWMLRSLRQMPLTQRIIKPKGLPAGGGAVPGYISSERGHLVASLRSSGVIDVWDANDGGQTATLAAGAETVYGGQTATLAAGAETVTAFAIHPDGSRLAGGTAEGTLIVWDASDWKIVSKLALGRPIQTVAYSGSGLRLTCATDEAILGFEPRPGGLEQVCRIDVKALRITPSPAPGTVASARPKLAPYLIAPDREGKRIATDVREGQVRVYDLTTGRVLMEWPGTNIRKLIWDSADATVASDSDDGLLIHNAANGKETLSLASPSSWIKGDRLCCWDDRGRLVTINGSRVSLRDPATGIPSAEHRLTLASKVWAMPLAGGRLAIADSNGGISVWSRPPGTSRSVLKGNTAPRLEELFPGFEGQNLRIYRTAEVRDLLKLNPDRSVVAVALRAEIGQPAVIQLLDAVLGTPVGECKGHESSVVDMDFTPDGRLLVTGGADGTLRVWAVSSGQQLAVTQVQDGVLSRVICGPERKVVVVTSRSVGLWDLKSSRWLANKDCTPTGQPTPPSNKPLNTNGTVAQVARIRDESGRRILSDKPGDPPDDDLARRRSNDVLGRDSTITDVNLEEVKGAMLSDGGRINSSGGRGISISRGGMFVTTIPMRDVDSSTSSPIIIDQTTSTYVKTNDILLYINYKNNSIIAMPFKLDGARCMDVSLDAKTIATGHPDGIRIRSLADGRVRHFFPLTSPITALSVSRNGVVVAAGTSAGTLHAWDPKTGKILGEFGPAATDADEVRSVTLKPDGSMLMAWTRSSIRFLSINSGAEHARLRLKGMPFEIAPGPDVNSSLKSLVYKRVPLSVIAQPDMDPDWKDLVYLDYESNEKGSWATPVLQFADLLPLVWPDGRCVERAESLGASRFNTIENRPGDGSAGIDSKRLHDDENVSPLGTREAADGPLVNGRSRSLPGGDR